MNDVYFEIAHDFVEIFEDEDFWKYGKQFYSYPDIIKRKILDYVVEHKLLFVLYTYARYDGFTREYLKERGEYIDKRTGDPSFTKCRAFMSYDPNDIDQVRDLRIIIVREDIFKHLFKFAKKNKQKQFRSLHWKFMGKLKTTDLKDYGESEDMFSREFSMKTSHYDTMESELVSEEFKNEMVKNGVISAFKNGEFIEELEDDGTLESSGCPIDSKSQRRKQ